MEKNNQCECYPPVWLEWENQMEPGHHCSYCQRQEYEFQESLSNQEPELSELMVRLINEAKAKLASADELPF